MVELTFANTEQMKQKKILGMYESMKDSMQILKEADDNEKN